MTRNHPENWTEYIIITDYQPKYHTADLMDIGGSFCVARWAIPENSQIVPQGFGLPWIVCESKWDRVVSSPPIGKRLPYSDKLWEESCSLAKKVQELEKIIKEAVYSGNVSVVIKSLDICELSLGLKP